MSLPGVSRAYRETRSTTLTWDVFNSVPSRESSNFNTVVEKHHLKVNLCVRDGVIDLHKYALVSQS